MQARLHTFCVAPMMDWTDRHCRAFHRILTRHALLYTEMVTAAAVIHGDRARLLALDENEHPVALQLGGSDPAALAEAAAIGEGFGYDEINLNVGCPSDRVQEGRFGACLMAEPELVAACVAAMRARVSVPVTVKCRIGIDDQDDEADLAALRCDRWRRPAAAPSSCTRARPGSRGLSPKENREVPPLDYARVYRLKASRPDLDDRAQRRHRGPRRRASASRERRRRDAGARRISDALHSGRRRPPLLRRCDRAFDARSKRSKRSFPMSRAISRRADASTTSCATSSASITGSRARALSAAHLSELAVKDGAGIDVLLAALRIAEPSYRLAAAAE